MTEPTETGSGDLVRSQPLYANVVQVSLGPFDVVLDFGFQSPEARKDEPATWEPVARIAMSIGHAKSMLPILARVIAQYEQELGPVPAPGFEGLSKE